MHIHTNNVYSGRAPTGLFAWASLATYPVRRLSLRFQAIVSWPCHFLRHVKQQAAVRFLDATEQVTKTTENARIFSSASPGNVVSSLPLGKLRDLRWFLTIVKELVHRNFHGSRQLFERLDGRNSVAVFDARDVATE